MEFIDRLKDQGQPSEFPHSRIPFELSLLNITECIYYFSMVQRLSDGRGEETTRFSIN